MIRKQWKLAGLVTAIAMAMGLSMTTFTHADAKDQAPKEAPAFTLTDSNGTSHNLSDFKGKWVILEWINHGCPFVVKHYVTGNMQKLQETYTAKGAVWLSICSSAEGTQGYYTGADWNKVNADKKGKATAILLDTDGKVGRAYGATRTPEMVIINPEGQIVYHGAIDSDRRAAKESVETATNYVTQVMDAVLAGNPAPISRTTPYGCSVKYAK